MISTACGYVSFAASCIWSGAKAIDRKVDDAAQEMVNRTEFVVKGIFTHLAGDLIIDKNTVLQIYQSPKKLIEQFSEGVGPGLIEIENTLLKTSVFTISVSTLPLRAILKTIFLTGQAVFGNYSTQPESARLQEITKPLQDMMEFVQTNLHKDAYKTLNQLSKNGRTFSIISRLPGAFVPVIESICNLYNSIVTILSYVIVSPILVATSILKWDKAYYVVASYFALASLIFLSDLMIKAAMTPLTLTSQVFSVLWDPAEATELPEVWN